MVTSTEYYKNNPDKYAARRKQIKDRERGLRDQVREYKKTLCCTICGFSDYRAIDFHHRNPNEKTINPSRMYTMGWGWKRIKEELDKCDPVCRNCHAILHAEERELAGLV